MKSWKLVNFFVAYFIVTTTTIFGASAINPRIMMDSNGNGVAVWLDSGSTMSIIANTYIEGVWGTPSTIMTGGTITSNPILGIRAIDTDEISAVVVWADVSNEQTALFSAMLPTSSGSWTSVTQLPLNQNETVNTDYLLRVNETDGSVMLIYTSFDILTSEQPVKTSTSTINGLNSWTTPEIISDS